MSATDHLGVQFRKADEGDRKERLRERKYELAGEVREQGDYEYYRIGSEDVDVDPKRERRAMRLS